MIRNNINPSNPALRGAEWLADSAYIAPGFHRLLTAGGLTAGLWGGRKLMDSITARRASSGEETPSNETPEILRPLHGIMRYNPYSDAAADRWKFVVDRFVPIVIGAFGAYAGGKLFFHGKMPSGEPFFAPNNAAKSAWSSNKVSTEATDVLLRSRQADAIRKPAVATFGEGSATGQHLFGALWPFNNGMIANSFMMGSGQRPWGPRFLFSSMRGTAKWMEANVVKYDRADAWLTSDILMKRVRHGLQIFAHSTVEQEKKLADRFQLLIHDAYQHKSQFIARHPQATADEIGHSVYQFVSGQGEHASHYGLLGASYDRLLHSLGFDLSKINITRGPWQFFCRLFGSKKYELPIIRKHGEYLKANYAPALDVEQWANEQLKIEPWKVAAAYGGGAAVIASGLAAAGTVAHSIHKESSHTHTPHIYTAGVTEPDKKGPEPEKSSGNIVDWLNRRPLDVAHWASRVVITPPSMHRFMNAAYLSLMLYGGMKLSNIMTGRKLPKVMSGLLNSKSLSESTLLRSEVWAPFRPLHGILSYTPGGALSTDRWRQALHTIMPVGFGVMGTYAGSYLYFKDRAAALEKPKTLEEYADRIAFEQSKVYAGATALTSIFNTSSGVHLLPIFNYSSNLHNRFLMGSGQQVAMPGIGKWWSGNVGSTPWGIKLSLNYLQNYLTYNADARPKELPALVHSVIGKLYPTLKESDLLDKKQIIIDRIHDVRDSYLVQGKIPASKQPELQQAMTKLLSGTGFEALLREASLNPAEADLASNGASGKIANFLGKRRTIESLQEEYRRDYVSRDNLANHSATDYLRGLLDTKAATHIERLKQPTNPTRQVA